jgi:hypothetical protein
MAYLAFFTAALSRSLLKLNFVIAGFNTDIEFKGTVYHVQTEDKGPPSREIMSLVYDRGTILASKRVSYQDLASTNFDEKKLEERLGRQHKLICAAVRTGRLDDLKEMTARSAAGRPKGRPDKNVMAVSVPQPSQPLPVLPASVANQSVGPSRNSGIQDHPPLNITIFDAPLLAEVIPDEISTEPVVDVLRVIEEEIISAEAVEVVSELAGKERPANQRLKLELVGNVKFKGGDRQALSIMIIRGTDRKVVPGAQIMVKILGSTFRPVIFHARSDVNGLARVHLQVPQFSAGRAALLVRAMADGEEVELRRIVTPG